MSATEQGTGTDGAGHWGEIDGVSIDFPLTVEEMNSATLTFTVPLEPARALLPGDAFQVLEVAPGQAMLIVALCDYIRNPWGDYNEVNLGLLVHPTGVPEAVGAFQWRMPVDQAFTKEAGNRVLGLPKTVEDLTVDYTDTTVTFRLVMGGEPTLEVRIPRVAPAGDPVREETMSARRSHNSPTTRRRGRERPEKAIARSFRPPSLPSRHHRQYSTSDDTPGNSPIRRNGSRLNSADRSPTPQSTTPRRRPRGPNAQGPARAPARLPAPPRPRWPEIGDLHPVEFARVEECRDR